MSVISKQLAHDIAFALTEKSKEAMNRARKEYENTVRDLYEQQTPDEVKKTFKAHPEWFCTRSEITFNGRGFNWERVYVQPQVIANSNNGRDAHLHLTSKVADAIITALRKFQKAEKTYKLLKGETEQTLLNLKTFKNIKDNIPEAAKYFPAQKSNMMLVVNVDSLRRKLAHQPEVKKEKI